MPDMYSFPYKLLAKRSLVLFSQMKGLFTFSFAYEISHFHKLNSRKFSFSFRI